MSVTKGVGLGEGVALRKALGLPHSWTEYGMCLMPEEVKEGEERKRGRRLSTTAIIDNRCFN